jgi:chaperonin GroEL
MLEDVAVLTGGTGDFEEQDTAGKCNLDILAGPRGSQSIRQHYHCRGAGKKEDIKKRITEIKSQIDKTTSDYDKENLERLKIVGRRCCLKSQRLKWEMNEKKARGRCTSRNPCGC